MRQNGDSLTDTEQATSGICARFLAPVLAATFLLWGCGPQLEQPLRICPGAGSAQAVLGRLRSYGDSAVSFRGNGQCRLEYYVEDKPDKENFPVKLWFLPPCSIRMQGDVAFNPRGLELGSNEREFWLAIRPKEISTYWWGKWSQQTACEGLILSPKVLVEALGVVEVASEAGWALSTEGPFDVLTESGDNGRLIKRVYVYNCDHRVRKIEYFDGGGAVTTTCELRKYEKVTNEFHVPTVIEVTAHRADGKHDSVRMSLQSVRVADFSEKQRHGLFSRRPPRGFSRVVQVVEGRFIEQKP